MDSTVQAPSWTAAESEAIRDLAAQLFERGHVERAADLLRALIVAVPTDRVAWRALATCHEAQGDDELADSLRALADHIAALSAEEPS